jgi:hypothetical protein
MLALFHGMLRMIFFRWQKAEAQKKVLCPTLLFWRWVELQQSLPVHLQRSKKTPKEQKAKEHSCALSGYSEHT